MRLYCDNCDDYVVINSSTPNTRIGRLVIKGKSISAEEEYFLCPVCGKEIFSNEMVKRNTHAFHNAYRLSLGSITAEEIHEILDMYDIGAQPLSLLLGWGANTIERQMKRTIPDREHAKRLRDLKDPRNMMSLLSLNKDRISNVAYKKAYMAARKQLQGIKTRGKYLFDSSLDTELVFSTALMSALKCVYSKLDKAGNGKATLNISKAKDNKNTMYQTLFAGGRF